MILDYQLDRNLPDSFVQFYYLTPEIKPQAALPGWQIGQQFLHYSPMEVVALTTFQVSSSDALSLVLEQDPKAYMDRWGFISTSDPESLEFTDE